MAPPLLYPANSADFHPFGYDPDGPDLYLCKGSPPAGTALPALPKTNHRVTLCVHKVLNIGGLHMRMRPEWLRAYFEYYTALGVDHFYVYVRCVRVRTPCTAL